MTGPTIGTSIGGRSGSCGVAGVSGTGGGATAASAAAAPWHGTDVAQLAAEEALHGRHEGAVAGVDPDHRGQRLRRTGGDPTTSGDHLVRWSYRSCMVRLALDERRPDERLVVLEQVGHVVREPARLLEEGDQVVLVVVERGQGHVGGVGDLEDGVGLVGQLLGQGGEVLEELLGVGGVVGEHLRQLVAVHERAVDRLARGRRPPSASAPSTVISSTGSIACSSGYVSASTCSSSKPPRVLVDLVAVLEERRAGLGHVRVDVDELLTEQRLGPDRGAGAVGHLLAVLDRAG